MSQTPSPIPPLPGSDTPNPNSKSSGISFRHCWSNWRIDLNVILSAKKEAKRLEKEAKLAAKVAKVTPTTEKTIKTEKEKKVEQPEFVNNTPKGEKKGESWNGTN
jgi:valyl-tRNA synthetase